MMQKFKLTLAAAALITALPLCRAASGGCHRRRCGWRDVRHDRRSTGVQTDDETAEWKAAQRVPEKFKAGLASQFHRLQPPPADYRRSAERRSQAPSSARKPGKVPASRPFSTN
jgi:hypothetical protein